MFRDPLPTGHQLAGMHRKGLTFVPFFPTTKIIGYRTVGAVVEFVSGVAPGKVALGICRSSTIDMSIPEDPCTMGTHVKPSFLGVISYNRYNPFICIYIYWGCKTLHFFMVLGSHGMAY